jgi:hypothetical protein
MKRAGRRDPLLTLGYAVGVGLVMIPVIGIPVRFMFPEVPPLLGYSAAFVAGLCIGAAAGWLRRSID